jgi:hypothetical protein
MTLHLPFAIFHSFFSTSLHAGLSQSQQESVDSLTAVALLRGDLAKSIFQWDIKFSDGLSSKLRWASDLAQSVAVSPGILNSL